MCFRNRTSKSAGLIPVAMMFLVVGILWPNFFHPTTQLWKNWGEALRGLMFGVSLGINLMAVRLASRQRRCGGSSTAAGDREPTDTETRT
jgi:hypothetical protein